MRRVQIGSHFKDDLKGSFYLGEGLKIRSCGARGKWKASYLCLQSGNGSMCVCVLFFPISKLKYET